MPVGCQPDREAQRLKRGGEVVKKQCWLRRAQKNLAGWEPGGKGGNTIRGFRFWESTALLASRLWAAPARRRRRRRVLPGARQWLGARARRRL